MSLLDAIRERASFSALWEAVSIWRPTRGGMLQAFLYFLYGALVFSVVLAARYYVRQADTLARATVAGLQGVTVEFPRLEPQLIPPRMTLDYLRVLDAKTGKAVFEIKDVTARFSLPALLVGRLSCYLEGRAYGGVVDAKVSTGAFFSASKGSLDLNLEMIELQRVPQVSEYDKTLTGFVSGQVSLSGEWAAPLGMEGDVLLNLKRLDMDNRFPVVKGSRLAGVDVRLDCSVSKGLVTVRGFDLKSGDTLSLEMVGAITLDESSVLNSKLDLNGQVSGDPSRLANSLLEKRILGMLKKKQPIRVTMSGPMASPRLLAR